jgi:hypothetical protein
MLEYIIIIPYRNRKQQLDKFINEIVPLFQKILKSFKVVVIEQEDGKLFNRGALLNIGYKEYKNDGNWFFNHDVDYYPTEMCIESYYLNHPNHVSGAIFSGFTGIVTPPCDTLGTVIKFPRDAFAECNGYPNNYWGWGVEDKALQNRVEFAGIPIIKVFYHDSPELKNYFEIRNDIDDRQRDQEFQKKTILEYDIFKFITPAQKKTNIYLSGLNNLNYDIISRETINEFVDLIKVAI